MKPGLLAAVTFSLLGICILSGSANAASDPRKCASTGGHISAKVIADAPTYCAFQAASLAFRRYMTARLHATVIFSAPMSCTMGATNLVWTCTSTAGAATVRFRALSNGWHTRVAPA